MSADIRYEYDLLLLQPGTVETTTWNTLEAALGYTVAQCGPVFSDAH